VETETEAGFRRRRWRAGGVTREEMAVAIGGERRGTRGEEPKEDSVIRCRGWIRCFGDTIIQTKKLGPEFCPVHSPRLDGTFHEKLAR
jgi:hypothetical protein